MLSLFYLGLLRLNKQTNIPSPRPSTFTSWMHHSVLPAPQSCGSVPAPHMLLSCEAAGLWWCHWAKLSYCSSFKYLHTTVYTIFLLAHTLQFFCGMHLLGLFWIMLGMCRWAHKLGIVQGATFSEEENVFFVFKWSNGNKPHLFIADQLQKGIPGLGMWQTQFLW